MKFYNEKETKNLIDTKEKLFYADDGFNEIIIRLEDIPDYIMDCNTDLKFINVNKDSLEPDITTMGIFLDKINPEIREKIIDRLIKLQKGETKIKEYKVIDEDLYDELL